MRLTLRTMLAYLDDILEPADAQELGNKIRESEFASGLVHRIRSSTRKLRLGAPKLEGKGIGLDANTVAEYLDNTLPQDRVPDFEKVCLESEVHLAEVASCHQILTLVLGEPAEVSAALRARIYDIPSQQKRSHGQRKGGADRGESLHKASASEVGDGAGDGEGDGRSPRTDGDGAAGIDVPGEEEYSPSGDSTGRPRIGGRSPVRTLALTLGLTFLVVLAALRVMGRFDSQHPLARLFAVGSAPETASAPQEDVVAARDDEEQPAATDAVSEDQPSGSSGSPTETPPIQEPVPATDKVSSPADEGPQTAKSAPAAAVEKPLPEEVREARPSEPAGPVAPQANDASASPDSSAMPDVAPAKPAADVDWSRGAAEAALSGAKDKAAAEDKAVAEDKAAAGLGRYISEEQVLARFDAESGVWRRLAPRAALMSGDRLLAPPAFRPQVSLASRVQLTFAGPTSLQALADENPGGADVAIEYGRVLLDAVGTDGAQIRLDLGGRRGTATFADAESSMAVEVRRYMPPGEDPEANAAQTVVQVFVTSGRVDWREGDGEAVSINAGEVRAVIDNGRPETFAAGELPKWIEARSLTDIDRLGSEELEKHIALDRPVSLSLQEQVRHRRPEVRALALRCLAYLGQYDSCVLALDDESYHSYWAAFFDALQDALSRGPESAAEVRIALERGCGPNAPVMYRLLWGLSPEQLETKAVELVASLEHESLGVRVLAFENLRRITTLTLMYQPEFTDVRRRSMVRSWRQRLEEGAIVYATPPAPLPARAAPPEPAGEAARPAAVEDAP